MSIIIVDNAVATALIKNKKLDGYRSTIIITCFGIIS